MRLLLWPQLGASWLIQTPDGDEYVEDMLARGRDGPVRCMLIPDGEVVPRSVRGRYYRYREAVPWEEFRQSVLRAKASITAEGWPEVSVRHAVRWTGEAVSITELLPEVVDPTPTETGGDEEWVALETRGGLVKGQTVDVATKDPRRGDRVLVQRGEQVLAVGVKGSVESVKGSDLGDQRLQPSVVMDAGGKRWIEFGEALKRMRQEPQSGWPLEGDRTTAWLLNYVYTHGGGFESRHTKWMVEQKIDKESTAAIIH
eukprot:4589295-Amphidinium_carterae.1